MSSTVSLARKNARVPPNRVAHASASAPASEGSAASRSRQRSALFPVPRGSKVTIWCRGISSSHSYGTPAAAPAAPGSRSATGREARGFESR